jgi:hypothetical protein
VTDDGSQVLPPDDLLPRKSSERIAHQAELIHCQFCRKPVLHFLRNGYLRHHALDQLRRLSSWPSGP